MGVSHGMQMCIHVILDQYTPLNVHVTARGERDTAGSLLSALGVVPRDEKRRRADEGAAHDLVVVHRVSLALGSLLPPIQKKGGGSSWRSF